MFSYILAPVCKREFICLKLNMLAHCLKVCWAVTVKSWAAKQRLLCALSSWWVVCWLACSVVDLGRLALGLFGFTLMLTLTVEQRKELAVLLYQNVLLVFPLSSEVFQSLTALFRALAQQPLLSTDLGIVVCSLTIKKTSPAAYPDCFCAQIAGYSSFHSDKGK